MQQENDELVCPLSSKDLNDDGQVITVTVKYMSPMFLAFTDWLMLKAPFGNRAAFKRAVTAEECDAFMIQCKKQHMRPGAREQLAEGGCIQRLQVFLQVPISADTITGLQDGRRIFSVVDPDRQKVDSRIL